MKTADLEKFERNIQKYLWLTNGTSLIDCTKIKNKEIFESTCSEGERTNSGRKRERERERGGEGEREIEI